MPTTVIYDSKPPGADTKIANAWEGIKGAPKWVYVVIVIGAVALWYGYTKIKPAGGSAEGKEGKEGELATGDTLYSPISNREGEADPQIAYWHVEAAPAGWASTLNGIATQFYGNTNRVGDIQKANPTIKQQPYQRLPTGLKVRVPR